jgi:hypothetical protein
LLLLSATMTAGANTMALDRNKNALNPNTADMSDTLDEMQMIVRAAAEPWAPGDSVKAAITRAARRLGISYRRAYTLWYAAHCALRETEAASLRAWYRDFCDREAERLEQRAALYRERRAALESRIHARAKDDQPWIP